MKEKVRRFLLSNLGLLNGRIGALPLIQQYLTIVQQFCAAYFVLYFIQLMICEKKVTRLRSFADEKMLPRKHFLLLRAHFSLSLAKNGLLEGL